MSSVLTDLEYCHLSYTYLQMWNIFFENALGIWKTISNDKQCVSGQEGTVETQNSAILSWSNVYYTWICTRISLSFFLLFLFFVLLVLSWFMCCVVLCSVHLCACVDACWSCTVSLYLLETAMTTVCQMKTFYKIRHFIYLEPCNRQPKNTRQTKLPDSQNCSLYADMTQYETFFFFFTVRNAEKDARGKLY